MHYVYILQSQRDKNYYTGVTGNLKKRLQQHNDGLVNHTKMKRPIKVAWYCAFANRKSAYRFEKYLKSGSGLAFAKKHLIS